MGLRDRKTLKPPIVVDATPPRAEARSKAARGKRGAKSAPNSTMRMPPSNVNEDPSPLTTPTTEGVPPLTDIALERLTSSMQDLVVKTEPIRVSYPHTPSPVKQASELGGISSADPEQKPIPEEVLPTQPSLKFKVRVPPAVVQQLRAQAGEKGGTPEAPAVQHSAQL
ncbi:hypothetical protein CALCODRAFT_94986 [Calocera cornea HHB12733]|uniref:Uncharacterized protein n=1 Tax=Calocera cornea HHB12733 TaxID=1353952 RepID=A0A165IIC8_9BASI|nr:hypothetical protein CALCODRAFT_94986 [Calocera cornea HHB12733]